MKMDIVCCHPSGVALQLSLLSWRGIRGCSVGNGSLLGVAPMGPDGARRGIFHFGVLVGGASYCRGTQNERLNRIQNESWFTPPLSQTGSILSFQFGGGTVDLRDCAIQHGTINTSVFVSWTLSAVVIHGRCLQLGDSCATLVLMNKCATWPAQTQQPTESTPEERIYVLFMMF